jgi:AraC-like DNA-binding protein
MRYLAHIPAPPLAEFVEHLWSLSDAPTHAMERIVPSGTQELVINLHENEFRIYEPFDAQSCRRFSGAIVSGAYRGSFVIDSRAHASVVGVHFRPGGAFPFLGLPPGELANVHVDLATLWGTRARALRDRLGDAPTTQHRFQILEGALLACIRDPMRRHAAVQLGLDRLRRGAKNIGELASQASLSRRRFIEVFTAEVGMTPKLFSRVQRFQRALSRSKQLTSPDWSQLALECGYFDQSHLIRDFVAFAGFSPAELLRHLGPNLKEHHVALFDAGRSNSSNMGARSRLTLPATRKREHGRSSGEL